MTIYNYTYGMFKYGDHNIMMALRPHELGQLYNTLLILTKNNKLWWQYFRFDHKFDEKNIVSALILTKCIMNLCKYLRALVSFKQMQT